MKRLTGWLGGMAAIAAWFVAPALDVAQAAPAPKAAAKPAAPLVQRMEALQAYEPCWLPDSKRLVFLGNRQSGEPVHVVVWEPSSGQLGRATTQALTRHSLTVSSQGKLAYVEQQPQPVEAPVESLDTHLPQPGPNNLVVHDLNGAPQTVFAQGWVQPGSVAWSPDGARLAFVTLDRAGIHRLALVTPGQAPTLVQLDQAYEFQAVVGWANDREVVLRANPRLNASLGPETLLVVGRQGVRSYRQALSPKLSPDGRWLLAKTSEAGGVTLRLLSGGARTLHPRAAAFDWAPEADRVYATVDRDVLALDLKGKVLKRWPGLAALTLGEVTVSPDGKRVAVTADFNLAVVTVR